MVDKLNSSGVKITAEPSDRAMHPILSILLSWFPMLLLIGVWIFYASNARWWWKSDGFW